MRYSIERRLPLLDAISDYRKKRRISFHVPGHKDGRGCPEVGKLLLGARAYAIDATEVPGLDNLNAPQGPIREAEKLAAQLYGSRDAVFLVNGSTCGVQAMIMAACQPGDKLIVSRNSHRSVVGGLILSGVHPIYVDPEFDEEFGIPLGIPVDRISHALRDHPDAVGVLLPNPNYYGIVSNLKEIAKVTRSAGRLLLVDEACGSHLCFSSDLPLSAIEVEADICVQSMHKMGTSLTQTSILHIVSDRIDVSRVRDFLSVIQTSSPSYVLMGSLDAARYQLEHFNETLTMDLLECCKQVREGLAGIDGLLVTGLVLSGESEKYKVDMTKVLMSLRLRGLSGYRLGNILREACAIEVELEDLYNILAVITYGSCLRDVDAIVNAMSYVASMPSSKALDMHLQLPARPEMVMLPREAMWRTSTLVPLREAIGRVSASIISPYPPGVPVVCPGERLSEDIVMYLEEMLAHGMQIPGIVSRDETVEMYPTPEGYVVKVL